MSAIHDVDVDLATFCGRIGNLYGRHGLCPPFALHDAAQGWIARDIPLSHCVDVIARYLGRNAGSHYSGSGDRNFAWPSGLIETSWYERSFARPPRPAPKQSRRHDWLDEHRAEDLNQRPGHREALGDIRPICPILLPHALGSRPHRRHSAHRGDAAGPRSYIFYQEI